MPKFEAARARHPAVLPYATPLALLSVLNVASDLPIATKEALTRALVTEQCESASPLWAAMLGIAYGPMLRHLRARLRGGAVPVTELDQIVFTSFLAVVANFPRAPWPRCTCRYLRQTTKRRVFDALRRAQEDSHTAEVTVPGTLDAGVRDGDPAAVLSGPRWEMEEDEADALVDLLMESMGGSVQAEQLDLVASTVIRGESLRAYLRRRHPGVGDAEFVRIYERVKRQRTRTVARLRGPLEALCVEAAESIGA
jgi:hypothetical protein